jgi:hypothetical protein
VRLKIKKGEALEGGEWDAGRMFCTSCLFNVFKSHGPRRPRPWQTALRGLGLLLLVRSHAFSKRM